MVCETHYANVKSDEFPIFWCSRNNIMVPCKQPADLHAVYAELKLIAFGLKECQFIFYSTSRLVSHYTLFSQALIAALRHI